MSAVNKILIIGGGIGGMSAAISLSRIGRQVELIDIDPEWRALGAGVTLNGGALRAFHALGVLDDVKRLGACGGQPVFMSASGEVIGMPPPSSPFGEDIPAIGGIMRPLLHKILQAHTRAAGATVRLGLGFEDLVQDEDGVTVRLSDGTSGRYDLVLGADGVNSTVRRRLFPDAPGPQFTGQGCWRAVVPRPADVDGPMMVFGRQKCGTNVVSKDEMYLYLLHNIRENKWLPSDQWLDLLKAELEEYKVPAIVKIREELSEASQINYRPLEAFVLPAPWYKGRTLLIGDAAHATTPHSAYGAGLAIEDGMVLAELIGGGGDLETVLGDFMTRRYDRCKAVVDGSVLQGALELAGAPVSEHMAASMATAAVIFQPI